MIGGWAWKRDEVIQFILPHTVNFQRDSMAGEEWGDVDSVLMGTVVEGDAFCQLQTSWDPCVSSLFPGHWCGSLLPPCIDTCCSSIPSPHPCPSFLAQFVPDSLLWFVSPALSSSLISVSLLWVHNDFSLPVFLTISVALYHSSFSDSSFTLGVHHLFCLLTPCSLSSLCVYLDQLLYLEHNSYQN